MLVQGCLRPFCNPIHGNHNMGYFAEAVIHIKIL